MQINKVGIIQLLNLRLNKKKNELSFLEFNNDPLRHTELRYRIKELKAIIEIIEISDG